MELSWSYQDTMRRIVSSSSFRSQDSTVGNYFPVALSFELNKNGCDIPIYCASRIDNILNRISGDNCDIVLPLCIDPYRRSCSGAETIIKHFVRFYAGNARLAKAVTPKGEVYYGAGGIILDKDFNPLMVATTRFDGLGPEIFVGSGPVRKYNGITVHLHPNVFLDDTSVLNKSLAKKGMQFFLSCDINGWDNRGTVKVVIDDCSQFIKKVNKPNVADLTPESFNQVLKDNINEVLGQFIIDSSRN